MGAHISVPMYRRTLRQRYGFLGSRCLGCGRVSFPPAPVCPNCGGDKTAEAPLSGRGKIYASTVIAGGGAPPEFARQAQVRGAYCVVLVELVEGPRMIAQYVGDPAAATIGAAVSAVPRRIYEEEQVVRYGLKFAPAPEG